MITREKGTYTINKELGIINLTKNNIYLNKDVDLIIVPFFYAGFLFHCILDKASYYTYFLKDSSNVDKVFFQKWSTSGTIILDLVMNGEYILNQFKEGSFEYLHPRKRNQLFIEILHKNLRVLQQRGVKEYIYVSYERKTVKYAENIDYKGIWMDQVTDIPNIDIQPYIDNANKEYKRKEKGKSIFETIKINKEKRRKEKKDFKDNFLKNLKSNDRYNKLILTYDKPFIVDRIKEELSIIINDGFGEYFEDFDLIKNYLNENNIIFHLKGSGIGSLVLYIMGLSNINPIAYNISFSRFLGNWKIADIDIDIPSDKREEILEGIAQIMNKFWKKMFYILNTSSSNFDKLVLHPTGILLEDDHIRGEIPLLKHEWKEISQFFDSSSNPILEKIGYLKYDLINSVVLNEIQENLVDIDIKALLNNWESYIKWDPKYNNELLNGWFDYFQLNAVPIRKIIKEHPLSSYEDLCKMVAINRPAILRRYKHKEIITNLKGIFSCKDKTIEGIVRSSNTGSMIIYQDQAIDLIAYILPHVSFKERMDLVKGRGDIKSYEKSFKENGLLLLGDKIIVNYLWEGIRAFKEYGLNKAHAFSYGFIPLLQLYSRTNKKEIN